MPATTPWYQGAAVPLAWTSTDTSGNPFEGTTVNLTVTLPDGTTTSPSPVHEGNGGYTASLITTQAGHHLVAWTATDTDGHADAYADTFEVQPSADPTIVSLAEAKEILRLTGTDQDAELQGFNAAATEVVEYVCGPVVVQTVMETLPARGLATMLSGAPVIELLPWTEIPPELANLGITVPDPPSPMLRTRVYGIEYPITQLYCDPRRGIVTHTSGLPFYYCDYVWQYRAGRPVIPNGIYKAAQIILEHLWQIRHGGTSAQDVAAGESVTVLPGFGFAVPNRALQLLAPFDKTKLVAV